MQVCRKWDIPELALGSCISALTERAVKRWRVSNPETNASNMSDAEAKQLEIQTRWFSRDVVCITLSAVRIVSRWHVLRLLARFLSPDLERKIQDNCSNFLDGPINKACLHTIVIAHSLAKVQVRIGRSCKDSVRPKNKNWWHTKQTTNLDSH